MNNETLFKLRKMRLPALAAAYREQSEVPDNYALLVRPVTGTMERLRYKTPALSE